MNRQSIVSALVALAAGIAVGWLMKPTNAHEEQAPERRSRAARISESKSRVKVVTTVVTNLVQNTVTNTVRIAEAPRGPGAWQAELERLKEEDPAEYAARTNRMAAFRARMLQRAESRLETLASIDTTGWSKRQIATHEKYQELIARREELFETLRPGSGATEGERQEAMAQLRQIGKELHSTGRSERNLLLDKTLSALGYKGPEAAEIKETISTIYSTTQDWGGGPHGGGGTPPPRPFVPVH